MSAPAASRPSDPASPLSSSGPPVPRALERVRHGWLEKFSVGRGLFGVKNWQRRYFTVTSNGLNYAKTSETVNQDPRTYIPFVQPGDGPYGEVKMNPVFLLPNVTIALHKEASDPSYYYFGIRFEENGKDHILLLRTQMPADRDAWVRFISQYLHVGSSSSSGCRGMPPSHPLDPASPKSFDPEELDALEKRQLRRAVVDWDEGIDIRAAGAGVSVDAPPPVVAPPSGYDSDDADLGGTHGNHGGRGGPSATPPKSFTPSASAAPTPRGGGYSHAIPDDDDEVERGRSGIQPSSRSVARQSAGDALRYNNHSADFDGL